MNDNVGSLPLQNSSGLILYNKLVPVEISYSDRLIESIEVSPFGDLQDVLRPKNTVTDNQGNQSYLCTGGEWVEYIYKNVGSYMGHDIDVGVKLISGDSRNGAGTTWGNMSKFVKQGHIENGVYVDNLFGGFTYFQCLNTQLCMSFYYKDTRTLLPIDVCDFTWWSLNLGEGFRPCDFREVTYYKFVNKYNVENGRYENAFTTLVDQGDGDPWAINVTSNDFTDVRLFDSNIENSFWKSAITAHVTSNTPGLFKFDLYSTSFWLCPTLSTLYPTADKPGKQIVDGSSRVISTERNAADSLIYEVIQPVETYGHFGNSMTKYSDFSFHDILPDEVYIQGAKVVKRKAGLPDEDVTGQGQLTITKDNNTPGGIVDFVFNSNYLKNGMEYAGESYVLIIDTSVSVTEQTRTFINKASTTICGSKRETEEVSVIQRVYFVKYNANGSSNPNHYTGEFTQNETTGNMADSKFEFGIEAALRINAYERNGYTFTGWNTKADGSGNSYTDAQTVVDLIGVDLDEITLYAQWEKKLGTETITVISEETGNPVSDVTLKLYKDVNGTETYVTTVTTGSGGLITVDDMHWFNYKWVVEAVPAGYVKSADTDFTINYNKLSANNEIILYMKHVTITLDSQVDCIIEGENAPAFLYHIRGRDVAGVIHEYNVLVQTDESLKYGTNSVTDLFAGEYTVTQIPVSRYKPETAENISNSTIDDTNAKVDVKYHDFAEVLFPYTLINHGWYYGVDSKINQLTK